MAWNGLTILNTLADGPKLTRQIAASLGTTSNSLVRCLRKLQQKGLLINAEGVHQITEKGRATLAEGREITSGPCSGQAASRRGNTLRAKAWRAMGMRDGFGLDDLLTLLCDGDEGDAENNLASYLRALEAAGFLTPMRPGSCGKPRWRLKRDRAGGEPPAWNKATRTLRDHNTGEVFAIPRKQGARHD